MSTKIVGRIVIAIAAILLLGPSASAAPTLLLQVKLSVPTPIQIVAGTPAALDFQFVLAKTPIGNDPLVGVNWTQSITAADVGSTSSAPPDQIAQLNTVLNHSLVVGAQIQRTESGFGDTLASALQHNPTHLGDSTFDVALFVPSLSAYSITDITRTIDAFYLQTVPFGHNTAYLYGGGQTVNVYGVPVPEPAGTTLTWIVLHGTFLVRTRR